MKKTFYLAVCLLVSGAYLWGAEPSVPKNGKVVRYFDNSKGIRYKGQFRGGQPEGEFLYYYNNAANSLRMRAQYREGERDVITESYDSLGHVVSQGRLADKKREGRWLFFYPEGDTLSVENYLGGVQQGLQQNFERDADGIIVELYTMEDGKKQGSYSRRYTDGRWVEQLEYRDDVPDGRAVYYDSAGLRQAEGDYCGGKRCGVWKIYRNGRYYEQVVYVVNADGSSTAQ